MPFWAKLMGKPVVAVYWGHEHNERVIQFDGDGRAFVSICGNHIFLDDTTRDWHPVANCTTEMILKGEIR